MAMDGMSPSSRSEEGIHISLTDGELDILSTMDLVRSPKAGAMVLFAGTFR
jgi:molybdopterin synthase catalytic subunit